MLLNTFILLKSDLYILLTKEVKNEKENSKKQKLCADARSRV